MPRTLAPLMLSMALIGCSQKPLVAADQNVSAPAPAPLPSRDRPDPTASDAATAFGSMLKAANLSYIIYSGFGRPHDCQDGRMAGQVVRACSACAVYAVLNHAPMGGLQAIRAERADVSLSFRRAISAAQPEVAPIDESTGVWVAAVPPGGPTAGVGTAVFAAKDLSPADLGKVGVQMSGGFDGAWHLSIVNGNNTSVLAGDAAILGVLGWPETGNLVKSLVGTCDGTTPPPLPAAPAVTDLEPTDRTVVTDNTMVTTN